MAWSKRSKQRQKAEAQKEKKAERREAAEVAAAAERSLIDTKVEAVQASALTHIAKLVPMKIRRRFPGGDFRWENVGYSHIRITARLFPDKGEDVVATHNVSPEELTSNPTQVGRAVAKEIAEQIKIWYRYEDAGDDRWGEPAEAVPKEPGEPVKITYGASVPEQAAAKKVKAKKAKPKPKPCKLCGEEDDKYPAWGPCPHQKEG